MLFPFCMGVAQLAPRKTFPPWSTKSEEMRLKSPLSMHCEEKDFVLKSHDVLKITPVCKVSSGIRRNLFSGMWSRYFEWQIPHFRGRAEKTRQLVSSVKKFNLLLVMVLEKKAKCLAKQFLSPQPASRKGKLVEQSGCRELQSGPWHLQAAKLLCFPSCCPSLCSLPTYTHSCSLPRRPWCPPMSKTIWGTQPHGAVASVAPATGTRAVYKILL